MLEIAEITNTTGNAYIAEQGDHVIDLVTANVTELGSYQFIRDKIGKDSRLTTQGQPDYIRDVLPYRLLARTTGSDIYECRKFLTIIGTEVASHNSITNALLFVDEVEPVRKEPLKSATLYPLRDASFPRKQHEITDLAYRLRKSSGLDIESLAQIFKVSRATYHRWLRGLPVSKRHRNYLLEILPLVEEAEQRLGSPGSVSRWLLTPISSGGKKPLEYLAEKQYDLFRGFLLHQRTDKVQFRPLKPSRRVFKPRKREEIEDVREQLRPHTWYDKNDDLNSSND